LYSKRHMPHTASQGPLTHRSHIRNFCVTDNNKST
jgi:hypothetical protein